MKNPGSTTPPTTTKSHVNLVVADTKSWEQWDEWAFVEVAGDLRDIKPVLTERIADRP